jgi:hypothetical protein
MKTLTIILAVFLAASLVVNGLLFFHNDSDSDSENQTSDFSQLATPTMLATPSELSPAPINQNPTSALIELAAPTRQINPPPAGSSSAPMAGSTPTEVNIADLLKMISELDAQYKSLTEAINIRNEELNNLNGQLVQLESQPVSAENNALIAELIAKIDALEAANQPDLAQLQSIIAKRAQTQELFTAVSKKNQETNESILGNFK